MIGGGDVHNTQPKDGNQGEFLIQRHLELIQTAHWEDEHGDVGDEVDDACGCE